MSKSLAVQILATLVVSFQASQTGIIMGWPSNTVGIFSSNSTVLSEPMTTFEISLLGSLLNAGGLQTAPFCGFVFNKLGRKYATVFFGLPFVICWAIISVTSDVNMVLVAVALAGVGAAGQAASPMFITEIAEDSVRGGLTACSGTGYFVGILLTYIFGGYFPYHTVVLIQLSLSILSVVLLLMMKESPVYLMLVGKEEEAAKSLAFYRWAKVSSKEVQTEIAMIKRQIDPNLEKMLLEDQESQSKLADDKVEDNQQDPMEKNTQDSLIAQVKFLMNSRTPRKVLIVTSSLVTMSILMGSLAVQVYAEPLFLQSAPSMPFYSCAILLAIVLLVASLLSFIPPSRMNSRSSRKVLMVTSSLVTMSILMGSLAVQVYAEPLFLQAVPSMPSNSCAILLAIVFVVASLLCVFLVDACGRRMLIIFSSLASGVCTLLLGTQLQLNWAPYWFSAVLIYVFSFGYTLGAAVVPFIIMSEAFLPEVRGLCNSIVLLIQWSMSFVSLLLFNELLAAVGPGPIFYAFSAVGFFCVVFTYRCLPEIKGLSVEQIQMAFLKQL